MSSSPIIHLYATENHRHSTGGHWPLWEGLRGVWEEGSEIVLSPAGSGEVSVLGDMFILFLASHTLPWGRG